MVYKKLNENVHGLSQKACRHQQNKELPQWLFFETIIRAFQWERESFWAIRVPPLSPNCWLKELDEVSNSKFFTKNIMIKNAILRHLIYLRDHYKSDTCRPMHYTWFVNSFSNANIFCKPSLDYFLSNIHLVKDKYKTLLQRCTYM